jgi:hypothetical protein
VSKVYVLFWFDVEDYIGPETDEALRRLLDIFDARGVRGSWKLVGEKLRAMESRGRVDIIRALSQHDVGYHTDGHSRHPTVAEYLQDKEWDEGVAEFSRRERPGYDDIQRIFGHPPTCYGQAGDSWAPHVFPVLKKWGVPLYLDGGSYHIGLDDVPFWYCGVLNIFRLRSNRTSVALHSDGDAVGEAERRFTAIADRLRPAGGVMGVYYHPCQFVNTTFTCPINFSRGANPPREQWRAAPLRPVEEIEEGFRRFAEYLSFVQAQPDVEILTGTEFVERAPDAAYDRVFTAGEIAALAEAMRHEITWQRVDEVFLSPAEVFGLIVDALAAYRREGHLPAGLRVRPGVLGPTVRGTGLRRAGAEECATAELLEACRRAAAALDRAKRLPGSIDVGGESLSPADLLATAAHLLLALSTGAEPENVALRQGDFAMTQHVGDDEVWNWGVLPPDFDGSHLLELARLQTWTMKPAGIRYA